MKSSPRVDLVSARKEVLNLALETEAPWWLERCGPTRSHFEHGSETLQR